MWARMTPSAVLPSVRTNWAGPVSAIAANDPVSKLLNNTIRSAPRMSANRRMSAAFSAFSNAVNDAFAHLGLTHTQMPHDRWRVWKTAQSLGLSIAWKHILPQRGGGYAEGVAGDCRNPRSCGIVSLRAVRCQRGVPVTVRRVLRQRRGGKSRSPSSASPPPSAESSRAGPHSSNCRPRHRPFLLHGDGERPRSARHGPALR